MTAIAAPAFVPACMSEPERETWYRHNGTRRPCLDCPAAFAVAMSREGRCNGYPPLPARSDDHLVAGRHRVCSCHGATGPALTEDQLFAAYGYQEASQ